MSTLLTITIALLITFIGARIAAHFKYPPILGQFAASLLLAIPLVKSNLFTQESINTIEFFGELAIIFLLLLTGLETDINRINQCKRHSILVAFFGSFTPLIAGFFLGRVIGLGYEASFVLGVSLSISAEGTNLAVLLQMKKLKSKIGTILISAGMIDDILGILYLSFILMLSQHSDISTLFLFPVKLIVFVIAIWLASLLIPKILFHFEKRKAEVAMFNVVILIALIFAILSELAGLSAIIGAFLAGIILQKSFVLKRDELHEEHEIETFLFGFIIPFFFINIALNFDFNALIETPALVAGVILIAMAGKLIGALLVKPFDNLKWRQLYMIGWGMNSRGVIELVVANLALNAGLIDKKLYSAIVVMAVVTTLISPFVMRYLIKKHPQIMNR